MNILQKSWRKFKNYFKRKKNLQEWEQLAKFLGVEDIKESELSEATYFACMKVLSEGIGKLPLKLLRYNDNNGISVERKNPLYRVVHDRPNKYMTSSIFWSTMEYNRNHYGNAYALITGGGNKTNLWILPSDDVEIWYDDKCLLSETTDIIYIYTAGDKRYAFSSEEMLHFKSSNTFDGIKGVPVREQLRQTVNGNLKAQKLVNKMYDNGFTGKAVVQYTSNLNETNERKFAEGIEKYMNGELKKEGIENIIPIPFGTSIQPLNLKFSDNQFLEVKQYSALQIASAFGIKPYQIGDYTKSSYASAEAQQLSFYVDTLLFIIKQYEEELTYKLLSEKDIENGLHFKFNIDVILRADYETKIKTLSTAVNSFLMTPNEARSKLDLEDKVGGDKLLGNGASIPVELTGSQYKKEEKEVA